MGETLDTDQVCALFGATSQTIYYWKKKGLFPKPINKRANQYIYLASEVMKAKDNGLEVREWTGRQEMHEKYPLSASQEHELALTVRFYKILGENK